MNKPLNVFFMLAALLAVSANAFLGFRTVPESGQYRVLAASQSSPSSGSITDTTRNKLLKAVLEQRQDSQKIQALTQKLITNGKGTTYNPSESLFGPFCCTVAAFTPGVVNAKRPLWERISLKSDNLKGQQYSFFQDGDVTKGSVINYSEIWGPALHLRATGTFVALEEDNGTGGGNQSSQTTKAWWSILSAGLDQSKKGRRKCPDDFKVTVSGASINLLGNVISIPIEGSSTLRVLYADPELRVFISPQSTDANVGDWEAAGLIVVQVRSDLVTGNESPIDLALAN